MSVKVESYVSTKGGKVTQVPAHERSDWGSKPKSDKLKMSFRRAGWEVRKGNGSWKLLFTGDLTEEQVRANLSLSYPKVSVSRWRKDAD